MRPKSIIDWKKQFLNNAIYAMNPNKSLKEHKEKLKEKDKNIDELHRQLGDITAQNNWLKKKVSKLDFKCRQQLINKDDQMSMIKQCQLLSVSRNSVYYNPVERMTPNVIELMYEIDQIYTEYPFFGHRRIKCTESQAQYFGKNGLPS